MKMTQQYIAGELSLRLGELQAVARDQRCAREVAGLRCEAGTVPLARLGTVVARAPSSGIVSAGTLSAVATPRPSAARRRSVLIYGNSASAPACSRKTSSSISGR